MSINSDLVSVSGSVRNKLASATAVIPLDFVSAGAASSVSVVPGESDSASGGGADKSRGLGEGRWVALDSESVEAKN